MSKINDIVYFEARVFKFTTNKKTACLEKKLYGLIKRIWPHQTQEICKAVFRNDLSCSKFPSLNKLDI